MKIEVERGGEKVRLLISGVFDEKGSEVLRGSLDAIDQQRVREVEIDCSVLKHFGSSSIGKLLVFYKQFRAQGGIMRVCNLPSPMFEMFLELKIDTLFPVSRVSTNPVS